jgi:single-stranded-DNA-specific exonuclease
MVAELDVNMYKKRYEVRLIDVRPAQVSEITATATAENRILDQRDAPTLSASPPAIANCPTYWSEFSPYRRSEVSLTLAYPPPAPVAPEVTWQQLVGIAKYLSRTGASRSRRTIQEKLNLSDRTLAVGLRALSQLGFSVQSEGTQLTITESDLTASEPYEHVAAPFLAAVREEQFRRQYFYQVSPETLQQVLGAMP